MLVCQFCGLSSLTDNDFIEIDPNGNGFWCGNCDGFTYLNNSNQTRHRFTLILEDQAAPKVSFSSPAIPLGKRLSPLRYPGGKTKIIDYLYTHIQETKSKKVISPFTGGGSFELALLNTGVIEHLHINDVDVGVFSLWLSIKQDPKPLIDRIQHMTPTHNEYFALRTLLEEANASRKSEIDVTELAWAALVVNRLAYSGIPKANPLGGRNGSQKALLSRWNPTELIKRIKYIHTMADKIEVTRENATDLIEESYWLDHATIFIDPPYVHKGKDLYHCYYTEDDHIELAALLHSLYHGMPGADIILTYDYGDWLNDLYHLPQKEVIGRVYSA